MKKEKLAKGIKFYLDSLWDFELVEIWNNVMDYRIFEMDKMELYISEEFNVLDIIDGAMHGKFYVGDKYFIMDENMYLHSFYRLRDELNLDKLVGRIIEKYSEEDLIEEFDL